MISHAHRFLTASALLMAACHATGSQSSTPRIGVQQAEPFQAFPACAAGGPYEATSATELRLRGEQLSLSLEVDFARFGMFGNSAVGPFAERGTRCTQA